MTAPPEATPPRPAPRSFLSPTDRWRPITVFCLPACFVVLFAWLALGGVHWNARQSIAFHGDGLFYLAQSKATIDHGWWWTNPSIGAPLPYQALAFAQNSNIDQSIVWIVGRFTRDVGLAVNVAWLIMLGLSAGTATWGLRRLGISRFGAMVAGVLFALTPFAIYRNIGHFNVVTYLIPFPATAALLLAATDRDRPLRARDLTVPVAGCALVGFNYIYFAFFGAFIVLVGALVGAGRARSMAPLRLGALCLGVVIVATSINLIPNVAVWREFGQPHGVRHLPAESEIYGLKIRHLISPTSAHWFPPFKIWAARDSEAHAPNENENRSARLGAVGALGFLGLMAALVFPSSTTREQNRPVVQAAAGLTVAVVLLGTVGGFGSLFSLLISPEIRAYNRVSPFIAYFALAGVAIWVDRFTTRRAQWRVGLWLVLLGVGLADQKPAFAFVTDNRRDIEQLYADVAPVARELEAQLPEGAMIYQLPVRPYPADPGIARMGNYDHFRPYLITHGLRWSYPALTRDQLLWELAVEQVVEAELPRYLAGQGFSAILINRDGYPDGGRRIEQALRDAPAGARVMTSTDHFVALDLRHLQGAGPR